MVNSGARSIDCARKDHASRAIFLRPWQQIAGDDRFTPLKPSKIRQCFVQCGVHFWRVVPGFKEQPFDFQYLVGPMGLAVHATHKIVFVEQGQREIAVATFRCGDVTFQLVVEGKQIG